MEFGSEKINVLYASDDNFAEVLGISICSLVSSTKHNLDIYVVDQGISEGNKENLKALVKNFNLYFIAMPDVSALVGQEVDISRYSMSMFSRLFISTLLPECVNKIIYLDCDTLICQDLYELFYFNLEGKTIGAVNDLRSFRYMRNLGYKNNYCYINSGVLVMDVNRYRLLEYEKHFVKALSIYNGLLEFPDNDLICMIMADDITLLPMKYNAYSLLFACSYNELKTIRYPSIMPLEDDYIEARENPVIIHYTTCVLFKNRPWNDSCTHPKTKEYLVIRNMTPWGSLPLRLTQATKKKKLQSSLISKLPRKLAIKLFGLVHACIKPNMQFFIKKRYKKFFPYVISEN